MTITEHTITEHFDNPDDAQAFVESVTVTVTATYPGGQFTRDIVFGEVEHTTVDQPDPSLTTLFAGFNAIYGGKQ